MPDTLVDTNVLLDVAEEDSHWSDWSGRKLAEAADEGALVINPLIFAELAGGYDTIEAIYAVFRRDRYRHEDLPWDAAFAAGHVFLMYRQGGGKRSMPLPDFFIGAHASVRGYRLLTRDRGYYRNYFPRLDIVTPETSP